MPTLTDRLNDDATPEARRRGEQVMSFLADREAIATIADLSTYLTIRKVERFRIDLYPSRLVTVGLPAGKEKVLGDILPWKPAGMMWCWYSLHWWQRGRRVRDVQLHYRYVG